MTLSANGQLRFPSLIKIFTMKAIYKVLALSGLAFAACDEGDYNDWVVPETTQDATEDEKLSSGFSATPADAINFETLGGLAVDYDTVFVKLFTPVLTGNTPDAVSYTIQLGSQDVLELDSTLLVPASYVKAAVESEFGKAPVERTLSATVCATETLGSIATKHKATVEVKATLVAPYICEEGYRLFGTPTNWVISEDCPKVTRVNPDASIYDDARFSVVVDAPVNEEGERVDFWFKFLPETSIATASPNGALGTAVDGSTESPFILGDKLGGAMKQPATDGAIKYRITIDMMEYKAYVEALAFEDYLYYAGDVTSWQSNAQPLLGDGNGGYTGYYFIKKADKANTWGFKFTNGIGDAATTWYGGKDGALGSDNISPEEDGFYQIDANLADNTYKITKIETISIIGSVVLKEDGTADTNWGTDAVMEYDEAAMAFVYQGKLAAGAFKFRANKDWALSWGNGAAGLTSKKGGDINLATEGTYKVTFAPRCDEKGTYTIEPVTE